MNAREMLPSPTDCLCSQRLNISKFQRQKQKKTYFILILQMAIFYSKRIMVLDKSMNSFRVILCSPVVPPNHRQTPYLPLSPGGNPELIKVPYHAPYLALKEESKFVAPSQRAPLNHLQKIQTPRTSTVLAL